MKCKNCGHKNKDESQFCIVCGEPLKGKPKDNNKLIIVLLIIIIILIAAGGFILFNNNSSSDDNQIEYNNSSVDNGSDVDVNQSEDKNISEMTESDENDKSTTDQTIIDEKTEYIHIYGVAFTVPDGGSFRTSCAYQFKFNGEKCEVEEVEHYETSDSQRTIEPYEFSKSYPGGESYMLTVNNHVWKGIKVEKDGKWFHISMKSNNDEDVVELLDWMYEKNSWVGH